MSLLFEPIRIGGLELKNRFVRAGTCAVMATEEGEATDKLINVYRTVAKGNIGLIISGISYVHPLGKGIKNQLGIHSDEMIPGLKKIVDTVHQEGGKIAIELLHAGLQTSKSLIKSTPLAPTGKIRNPVTLNKSKEMNEEEIQEAILAFGKAARRADEAGVDAIHIDAAGGYLINQFLSPFFNHRKDQWGGSEENQFRFLKEVFLETRRSLDENKPIIIKINGSDHIDKGGITLSLASRHALYLKELKIDALELGSGTNHFSTMYTEWGRVPLEELVQKLPLWQKPIARKMLKKEVGKYDFTEPFNLEAAKKIKPNLGDIPLILVGGIRKLSEMKEIIDKKHADLIAMCRPFIREPNLVRKLMDGQSEEAACISCNRCFAATAASMPVRCYVKGFPIYSV
jgi:2,4-dienoyl-CoA reductase-like NADH-dependent reductase (Old Yellow Enzyme family)